jgi:hypothetical protein
MFTKWWSCLVFVTRLVVKYYDVSEKLNSSFFKVTELSQVDTKNVKTVFVCYIALTDGIVYSRLWKAGKASLIFPRQSF